MSAPKVGAGFTPVPWEAVKHGLQDGGWWSVIRGAWDVSHNWAAQPGVVADARYSVMTPEENAANARLIAASPTMYAALERIIETAPAASGDFAAALHAGAAALAKAGGSHV